MRKLILFLLISLPVLLSCNKSGETKIKNDILFTEINPYVIIGYENAPNHGHIWSFDLNKDSVTDFVFSPGYGYAYGDTVPIMDWFCIYAKDSNLIFRPNHKLLDKDQIVSETSQIWAYESVFYASISDVDSDSCKYLGLQLIKNKNKYFGWICLDWDGKNVLVTVRSYAVQKIPDIPILTGQVQ